MEPAVSLITFGEHDQNTLDQMQKVSDRAEHAALLPDGHLGYVMPIGGVAAYRDEVSVVGVGYDIGCGNTAIRTNLHASEMVDGLELGEIADNIYAQLDFGLGGDARGKYFTRYNEWSGTFETQDGFAALDSVGAPAPELFSKAYKQFGTIGGGNHYVDIFQDEQGYIWVGVHFGSRGLGHTIASGFLALAQGRPWGARVPEQETILHRDNVLGSAYLRAMKMAGSYARLARLAVTGAVVDMLGGQWVEVVQNHHNFAFEEKHFGQDLIVVRKGSTPLFPRQLGFVGGSMGDDSYILEGVQDDELGGRALYERRQSLYSTIHGAGRVMSRTAAKGKWKRGALVKPGAVTHAAMREWLDEKGVVVRGGDLDEAPQAYRRLSEVVPLAPGARVAHTLEPLIVMMAAGDTVDPYKD